MKPTDDDDDGIPDEPQDELIAQIVPLRRREDDTKRHEQPHHESQAAAQDTDDWSVFDPPEDLQLAERPRPDHTPGTHDDDLPGADSERRWASTLHLRNRLVAFAGIVITTVAIAALVLITLKGHAGASPHRPVSPTPTTSLTSASRAHGVVPRGGSPTTQHRRTVTRPSHHKAAKRRSSSHELLPSVTAGATSTPTSTGSTESASMPTQSSASGASAARGTPNEFGFER